MNWVFRIATSPAAGAGHLMRCLVLARSLPSTATVVLDPDTRLADLAVKAGVDVRFEGRAGGFDTVLELVTARPGSVLVVDGYHFAEQDVAEAARRCRVARIDDLGAARAGHVVINPGLGVDASFYPEFSGLLLLGTDYVLVDPLFVPPRHPVEHGVLIAFGALDSANASGAVVSALAALPQPPPTTVVLGEGAPHLEALRGGGRPWLRVLEGVSRQDMCGLYHGHAVAVGTGGVSLFERMRSGLPSVLLTTADNQVPNARAAAAAGAAIYLGDLAAVQPQGVRDAVGSLLADQALRRNIVNVGFGMIDGLGAERIARALWKECVRNDQVSL